MDDLEFCTEELSGYFGGSRAFIFHQSLLSCRLHDGVHLPESNDGHSTAYISHLRLRINF